MKILKISRTEPEFLIFKYLWILIVMPKTIQFFLLVLVLLYSVVKGKTLCFSKTMMPFLFGVIIQSIAIIGQLITTTVEIGRLMASINTALMWILSILFFSIYCNKEYSEESVDKLKKYVLFNFIIIILLYIFSLFYKGTYVNVLGNQLAIRRNDYITGSLGSRFCALMETPLASSHFFLFSIPIVMLTKRKNDHHNFGETVIVMGAFVSCAAAHSRIGMLISMVALIPYVFMILEDYGVRRKFKNFIIGLFISFALVYLLFDFHDVYNAFYSFFASREGSNNARFQVYKLSIDKAWNESPIIGIGIKYMMNNYIPYGSHSTYIGLFYKTGILGCILFGVGFFKLIKKVFFNTKRFIHGKEIFIVFVLYFSFLVFADIDGIDWVMACLFSMWGLLCNKKLSQLTEKNIQNELNKNV